MGKKIIRDERSHYSAWEDDQFTKSDFFLQKLNEWGLRATADQIENVRGETFTWNLDALGIAPKAWDKIVHRGIKPVTVFAHPDVLQTISRSVGYYRMLAMVSQKSMIKIRLPINRYEAGKVCPDSENALVIANRLNQIISHLVQSDKNLDVREFDLWRGMAAGSQAQGSWQNLKGKRSEVVVRGIILRRLREKGLVADEDGEQIQLKDGRVVVFADEPDIAIYENNQIQVAIEIKGGIDTAGILERVGAAIKSLSRAKEENPSSVTILLIPGVSLTQTAADDLAINQDSVNHWFTTEDFSHDEARREQIFALIGIG